MFDSVDQTIHPSMFSSMGKEGVYPTPGWVTSSQGKHSKTDDIHIQIHTWGSFRVNKHMFLACGRKLEYQRGEPTGTGRTYLGCLHLEPSRREFLAKPNFCTVAAQLP